MTKNYKENSYFIKVTAHNPDFYTRTACNTETSANAAFLLSSEDERLAPLLLEKKKRTSKTWPLVTYFPIIYGRGKT